MSAYGAGKMAEGVAKWAFLLLAIIAGIIALVSLGFQMLGPAWSAAAAAVIVYIVGFMISQGKVVGGGTRIGAMVGAAAGAYAGGHVYQSMGGFGGAILGALVTAGLTTVLMGIGWMISASIANKVEKEKKKKAERQS